MQKRTTLRDVYKFAGFHTHATLTQHPNDPGGYVLRLERRQKNGLLGLQDNGIGLPRPAQARVRDLDAGAVRIYLEPV